MRSTAERDIPNRRQRREHLQWTRKTPTHFGLPNRERETDAALRERLIAAGKIKPKQEQK